MPGAASPEEAVFTGADDPTASPVAQQIIKQLQAQGVPPTAANMRRAVESNARGVGQAGPDVLEGVRNDVVENSARPAARSRAASVNPPNANLGGNPYGDEGPATNPGSPTGATPFVDPATGILMTPEGGVDAPTAYGPILGSLIVAATRIPGLRNLLPGIGDLSGVKLNPNPGALPAPPPPPTPQIAAPQARLPAPSTPPIVPGQGGIPTMTVTPPATPPTTSASPPSVIRMPGPTATPPAPPPAPVAPPTAAAPGRPPIEFVKPDPARIRALQLQLAKRPPGMGQGNPFTNVK